MTVIVAGLRCNRCSGTSVRPIDPSEGFVRTELWVCPHCFDGNEHDYRIDKRYDVVGFKPVADSVDVSHAFDEVETDLGELTETQWEDYRAVRCEGMSYAARGRERDVGRGTVWQVVDQAEAKLAAGG